MDETITLKRPTGGSPITRLPEVLAALVMVRSCAANLHKIGAYEENSATLLWIHDEVWIVLAELADLAHNPVGVSLECDALVEHIRQLKKNKDATKVVERGEVWMVSSMAMLLDDIMVALRDPAKQQLVKPIVEAGFNLQMSVEDSAEFYGVHNQADRWVKEIYSQMATFRKKRRM